MSATTPTITPPTTPERTEEQTRAAWHWLAGHVRPRLGRLGVVIALSLVATSMALAQPYLTKVLIDSGLLAGDMSVIVMVCLGMLGLGAVAIGLDGITRWIYVHLSAGVLFDMREGVYRHLQCLSPAWHGRADGGDVMARLDGDVAEVQRFAIDSVLALVSAVFALVGTVVAMLLLSPQLTLLAFAFLPLQALVVKVMRPMIERQTRRVRERSAGVTGFLFDTLRTMKFVQSFGAEDREARRLRGLSNAYLHDMVRLQMINFAAASGPGFLGRMATALVFLLGGWYVVEGRETIGTLIAFSAYLSRASGPVLSMLGLYVAVQRAKVSLVRVRELLDLAPAVSEPATPLPLPADARGRVELRDVTFGYPGGPPVLRGASCVLPAGAKVGLVGPSGAGKTTLIDLLHRHFDPQEGTLTLDGVDLRALSLADLRRRVAVIAQEAVVVRGSVAENIAYARPDASRDDIEQAARAAELGPLLDTLPDGLDSPLMAGGGALSGGERQRLALARALLLDPLVLVLDEPASALDRDTASAVMRRTDTLFADRTRLIISHHPEPLGDLDILLELRDGVLVEREAAQWFASP